MIPLAVLSSASIRLTTARACSGRAFVGFSPFGCLDYVLVRCGLRTRWMSVFLKVELKAPALWRVDRPDSPKSK
jgi:hypothetical protein